MTRRPYADRAEAERDCAAVTAALRAGHPATKPPGARAVRTATAVAAEALGLDRNTLYSRIGTPAQPGAHHVRFGLQPDWSVAAARGELGTAPVLPGYELAGTSTQLDGAGKVEREWVRQKRAAGAPEAIPAGHVVKGLSVLQDGQGRTLAKWVKTREAGIDPLAFAAELRAAMLDARGAAPLKAPQPAHDDELLTVYVIPDVHLGLLANEAECGEAYDLKIAAAMIRTETARLMAMAPPSRHAVALFLGDFFHANDQRNATPRSGHALDSDSRWRKTYGIGARVAVGVCTAIAERHENVEVAFLPGNHDEDAAVTLAVALELYFEGHARVNVSPGAGIHWFRRFGKCLLGASHGHALPPERMAWLLAADRPQDWGETEYRHFFFGHIHHSTAKDVGPVRVESFSTPAAKDAYAHAGGYRSSRALNAVTFHVDDGEVCRHRVNIRPAVGAR